MRTAADTVAMLYGHQEIKTPLTSVAAETNPGQLHVWLITEVHTTGSQEGCSSFFPTFTKLLLFQLTAAPEYSMADTVTLYGRNGNVLDTSLK